MEKRSCELEYKMTNFTSDVKTIPHNRQLIYDVLSNLENLAKVKDRFSGDRIQDFTFDRDSCSFSVSPLGQLRFVIVERNAPETVQLAMEQAPVDANLFIRLTSENETETRVQLSIEANLNPFFKSMVSAPLQEGINKIADALTLIPYNDL